MRHNMFECGSVPSVALVVSSALAVDFGLSRTNKPLCCGRLHHPKRHERKGKNRGFVYATTATALQTALRQLLYYTDSATDGCANCSASCCIPTVVYRVQCRQLRTDCCIPTVVYRPLLYTDCCIPTAVYRLLYVYQVLCRLPQTDCCADCYTGCLYNSTGNFQCRLQKQQQQQCVPHLNLRLSPEHGRLHRRFHPTPTPICRNI